jgi:nucleoid-associated protein YgaU
MTNIPMTITVVGGNLWAIAAKYLGDATQASRIAALNGLSDPMLSGQITLTLPSVDATKSGGLSFS